jgi:hypothetical protein
VWEQEFRASPFSVRPNQCNAPCDGRPANCLRKPAQRRSRAASRYVEVGGAFWRCTATPGGRGSESSAEAVPSSGWREVAAALDAEEGVSHE